MKLGPLGKLARPAAQLLQRLATTAPRKAKVTIGLDIGSSSVKAIALGSAKTGSARLLLAHALVPLPSSQDADAVESLRAAVADLHVPIQTVHVAVSGPWVVIRIVEMPIMSPSELRQALPFEAQRYLPFNIQDVVVDGTMLGPIDAHKAWTLVVACKKELLERRLDWVKRAGLSVSIVDVDALAVANSFLARGNGTGRSGASAVINAGAQLTNLVIFQGDIPYLVRDIPWGAEKLIRAVAEHLGKEPADVAASLAQPELEPELQNAVKLVMEVLVTELQLSFDYFENRFGHPPEAVFLSGGLGDCPGFVAALTSHLTQPVSAWAPAEGVEGRFAVAYGLALRTS